MTATKPRLRRAAEDFLFEEARLLDDHRLDDWVDLFEPDGHYWVPMAWDQPDPLNHVSLFYESVELLRLRSQRLQHELTVSQWPPTRTCHQVSNVMIETEAKSGVVNVRSALVFIEYRRDEQRYFAGHTLHQLRPRTRGFGIILKRVNLLNSDSEAGHLRMAIPF